MTCESCRYWQRRDIAHRDSWSASMRRQFPSKARCFEIKRHLNLIQMEVVTTTADFGCNRFEPKGRS